MSQEVDNRASEPVDVTKVDLTLGDAIRVLRERNELSARALSIHAGLSESYCGKIEKGSMEPSLRAFARIVRELHLSSREVHVLVLREAMRAEGMAS